MPVMSKPKPNELQELDMETLQDVIDRMIKYGDEYLFQINMLNRKYQVKYDLVDQARVYKEPLKNVKQWK
jgi:hypothetical protein